jgi:COMPASS component BRE2
MLAESDELPAAAAIRVDITAPLPTAPANKKRKTAGGGSASSPAPETSAPLPISIGPHMPTFHPVDDGPYCTLEHVVVNHNGFRYTPAGRAPEGSTLHARTVESLPACYRVSWEDRSSAITTTRDGLGVAGGDGWRGVRGNAPVRSGAWYAEVTIDVGNGARAPNSHRQQGAHVRLGWARREASLYGPAGMDGYSYGIRDATGERVTFSRPKPYGVAFGPGDVVGMYISLPPLRQPDPNDPADPAHTRRERIPIQLQKLTYFESKEYPPAKEMAELLDPNKAAAKAAAAAAEADPPGAKKAGGGKRAPGRAKGRNPRAAPPERTLPVLEGSQIAFFVNGVCQGVAFTDLFDFRPLRADATTEAARKRSRREGAQAHRDNPFDDGTLGYYPLLSLFNGARARFNPGPNFKYPPPADVGELLGSPETQWRPLSDRYPEYVSEQAMLDEEDDAQARVLMEERRREAEVEEKVESARAVKRTQAAARKRGKNGPSQPEARSGTGTPVPEEGALYAPNPLRMGFSEDRSTAASPAPEDGVLPSPLRVDFSRAESSPPPDIPGAASPLRYELDVADGRPYSPASSMADADGVVDAEIADALDAPDLQRPALGDPLEADGQHEDDSPDDLLDAVFDTT